MSTIALLSSGVAFAAWTATGSGNGTAKATSAQALVVTAGTITTGDLYPGKTGGIVRVSVSNPNPFPVLVTSFTVAASSVTADGGHPGCTPGNNGVNIATGTINVPNQNLAATTGSGTFDLPIASMTNFSNNACQGATFTVGTNTITANGASNA